MYLGRGQDAVATRASVVALAESAIDDLRTLGADVVETDFPLIRTYESAHAYLGGGYQGGLAEHGYVPEEFADSELVDLCAFGLDDFLRANAEAARTNGADPQGPTTLQDVDETLVFPTPPGQIPDEYGDDFGMGDYVRLGTERGVHPPTALPHLGEGVTGLDRARRELFEHWLDEQRLDALVFPTSADIAPSDADTQQESHDLAWRNGTWVANGNLAIRHLGIPTVTVPMGVLDDIGMPSGLTFAGRAWQDLALLSMAWEYDNSGRRRTAPPRTPELPVTTQAIARTAPAGEGAPELKLDATLLHSRPDARLGLTISGELTRPGATEVSLMVNGVPVPVVLDGRGFTAQTTLPGDAHDTPHSTWRAPYGTVLVATAHGPWGEVGRCHIVGGV
jgi:amidase